MTLGPDECKGREAQADKAQHATDELIGVQFTLDAQVSGRIGDFGAVSLHILHNNTVLAGVDVELKFVFAPNLNISVAHRVLMVVSIATFGFLDLFTHRLHIGAVRFLNHENRNGQTGDSGRVFGGHR